MTEDKRNAMRKMASLHDDIMATASMFKGMLENPEKAPAHFTRDYIKGQYVAYEHALAFVKDTFYEMFSNEDFMEFYD